MGSSAILAHVANVVVKARAAIAQASGGRAELRIQRDFLRRHFGWLAALMITPSLLRSSEASS